MTLTSVVSLLGALIALVIVDIAATVSGASRSHNRGDRIIETQIDIAARLGRIESHLADRR